MNVKDARIAIYGAGAMGTVLGVLLKKGGLDNVELITRNEKHVNGMRENGATVHCEAEGTEFCEKVRALFPKEMSGKYDLVFLMTKQRNNAQILTSLLPYLKEDSIVCTTQNGLPEESVAAIVGKNRTYGAATSYGATFIGGGTVALTSKFRGMRMEIGGYQNDNAKLDFLAEVLTFVGRAINIPKFIIKSENLSGARWAKLSVNAAFSGLSVVTGLNFGEIAKRKKTRKIALAILRECIDVAKASGVAMGFMQGYDIEKTLGGRTPLKRFISYLVLPFAMKKHKKLVSGMKIDVQNGRKCEVDFINGAVVKAGASAGIETPFCEKVVEIAHGIENGLYEMDYQNIDFFTL